MEIGGSAVTASSRDKSSTFLNLRKTLVANAISAIVSKAGHVMKDGSFTSVLQNIDAMALYVVATPNRPDENIQNTNNTVVLELCIGSTSAAQKSASLNRLIWYLIYI